MRSAIIHPRRPVMLTAGFGSHKPTSQSGAAPERTVSWQVDEAVVALTRAAISRRIPLAIPIDVHYAPLVAHVASEYVTPEVAEGESQRRFDGELGEGLRAVTFLSLGKSSLQARRRVTPGWSDVFRELKVVSDEVQPIQQFIEMTRPLAAVGVGHGTKVNAFLAASRLRQLPCWRLVTSEMKGGRRPAVGESFSQLIEQQLVKLRGELVFIPIGIGSRLRDDGSEGPQDLPPFFRAYPPLALYAQMLMERLSAVN